MRLSDILSRLYSVLFANCFVCPLQDIIAVQRVCLTEDHKIRFDKVLLSTVEAACTESRLNTRADAFLLLRLQSVTSADSDQRVIHMADARTIWALVRFFSRGVSNALAEDNRSAPLKSDSAASDLTRFFSSNQLVAETTIDSLPLVRLTDWDAAETQHSQKFPFAAKPLYAYMCCPISLP